MSGRAILKCTRAALVVVTVREETYTPPQFVDIARPSFPPHITPKKRKTLSAFWACEGSFAEFPFRKSRRLKGRKIPFTPMWGNHFMNFKSYDLFMVVVVSLRELVDELKIITAA